jgi:dolichyl-phosphate beta-glucosyltransferase
MKRFELAVVVPCYNERKRLRMGELLSGIQSTSNWIWILVNDGSTDGTKVLLDEIASSCPNARVLQLDTNRGKAEAVRQGVLQALSSSEVPWVGFLDADLATPVPEFSRMHSKYCDNTSLLIVTGCRLRRLGVDIGRTALRHYSGRVVATAISLILKMPTYDTQCGAKLFRRDIATKIFHEEFSSRWLFDVELLARARNLLGLQKLTESVVEDPMEKWLEISGSKLTLSDLLRVPFELLKLHFKYN